MGERQPAPLIEPGMPTKLGVIIASTRGEIALGLRSASCPSIPRQVRRSAAVLQMRARLPATITGPLINTGCSMIAVQKSLSLMKRSSSCNSRKRWS